MDANNNDYEQVLKNIAQNVRRLRKERGWSQEDLANAADIDRTYIGYIENCKNNVSIKVLCRIAEAIEMDADALLKYEK